MSKSLDALKELLYGERKDQYGRVNYPQRLELAKTIEKELKALEIIKEKRVDLVGVLLYAFEEENGCDFYNSYMIEEKYKLTQEEYDFLKEVLL